MRLSNLQRIRFPASCFIRASSFVIRYFLLLLTLVAAQALESPPSHFDDAAQDGDGVVWAFSRAEYNKLYAFDGKAWSERLAPIGQDGEAMPARLGRLPGGAVACVWRLGEGRMAITQHRGAESKLLAECDGKINQSGHEVPPFGDSRGGVWITGGGAQITRADSSGGAPFIYHISPEQLIDARKTKGEDSGYNPICAVEDGRGRVWVWSRVEASNYASLRGVLIFDGKNVEQKEIHGIKNGEFSQIARKDGKHMRVAVPGDGLYEVDMDTLQATREAVPDENSFCCVRQFFSSGDDFYVITESGFKGTLWRLRDGTWKRLIDEVDSYPDSDHNWLSEGKSLILCAQPTPWLIEENSQPVRLDWQNGFPIDGARKIFRLADASLYALCHSGSVILKNKLPLQSPSKPVTRVTEIKTRQDWEIDANDHLWTIPEGTENGLNEWNGKMWLWHKMPADLRKRRINLIAADTQGRIWIMFDSQEHCCAFFDSRHDQWRTFSNAESAFESVKKNPPQWVGDRSRSFMANYSTNRRIAFITEQRVVTCFDGTQWHRWKLAEIAPNNHSGNGAPFFNDNQQLCLNIGYECWRLNEKGAWQQTDYDPSSADIYGVIRYRYFQPDPPEGSPTLSPDSVAIDNQDVVWLTWQGKLYKCLGGKCVDSFLKHEPNPFTSRRLIRDVWTDRCGNVFLKTVSADTNRFMIAPKSPPPKTSVEVKKTAADSVEAQLHTDSPSQIQLRWRLDDEPWKLTKEKTLALDSLPNGPHTLTVLAIDEELQTSPATVAKFQIKISPKQQMAALIKRLADPDFVKRESAVAALTRQPALALPALTAAREKAGDDQRWWIDAAIQEIERKLKVKN
jgi:hypothetical protein